MLPLQRLKKYFIFDYNINIVELFKPLYILLSITGLFPFTIEFPKGRHDTRVIRKPLVLNIFGAVMCIAFLFLYFTAKIQTLMNTAETSSVKNFTNIIEISLALLSDIVIYFSAFQNAHVYLQILRDIAACWADLSHTNVNPILKFLHGLFVYPVLVWSVIFTSVQITLCIIGNQEVYKQLLFFAIPDVIPSLVVAFYGAMVLLVIGLLKNIQHHCEIIVESKRVKSSVTTHGTEHIETLYPSVVTDLVQLGHLEKVYVRVLETKQDINNAFQAPIFLIIIHCFHGILSDAHTLYREIVADMRFDAHLLIDQAFWVSYSLAKIYALTVTGSLLKQEATKIGQALHNIPTENQDSRLLMEVQHFATLMSFRGPVVTVYDYFSLDATLLFSMIATAVTYLVILVQFDTS